MSNTVLITGASSGIGEATARYFAARGWNVAATMRTPSKSGLAAASLALFALDVTDEATIQAAVDAAIARFGRIDAVVNNAGFALVGPFEAATHEQIARQFDTNVFGLMNVTRAVLPHFRERKSGTFVNLSSIGGRLTFPFYSLYHGTKWAVEGFSESLQFELAPFNIRVKIVEPGPIKTDFYERSMTVVSIPPYDASLARAKPHLDEAGRTGASPDRVAATIFRAAADRSNRLRYPVNARLLVLRSLLPESAYLALMKRVVMEG